MDGDEIGDSARLALLEDHARVHQVGLRERVARRSEIKVGLGAAYLPGISEGAHTGTVRGQGGNEERAHLVQERTLHRSAMEGGHVDESHEVVKGVGTVSVILDRASVGALVFEPVSGGGDGQLHPAGRAVVFGHEGRGTVCQAGGHDGVQVVGRVIQGIFTGDGQWGQAFLGECGDDDLPISGGQHAPGRVVEVGYGHGQVSGIQTGGSRKAGVVRIAPVLPSA